MNPRLEQAISARGFAVDRVGAAYPDLSDADAVIRAAEASDRPGWIVIDGYRFASDYHNAVRRAGWSLLVVDDCGTLDYYGADIVLNQNVNADAIVYRGSPGMRSLLGPSYALLREEFTRGTPTRRPVSSRAEHLLVMMGGGDAPNVTERVLDALLGDVLVPRVRVVVGPSNPRAAALEQRAARSGGSVEVLCDPPHMPDVMAWADVALTSAGTTCWELAYLGVPFVTIVAANNQLGIAEGLANRGASVNLGWHSTLSGDEIRKAIEALADDPAQRKRMRAACGRLVDGAGADRVVMALGVAQG